MLAGFVLAALALSIAPVKAGDSSGPDAAWDGALVVMPGGQNYRMDEVIKKTLFNTIKLGTTLVVYMHPSDGIYEKDPTALGKAGFLVIVPDSFKRTGRVKNCVVIQTATMGPRNQCGHFPQAPVWRMEEIKYTVERLKSQPQLASLKWVLMGFSEGGLAVANWRGPEFKAVIITGYNCRTKDNPSTASNHLLTFLS